MDCETAAYEPFEPKTWDKVSRRGEIQHQPSRTSLFILDQLYLQNNNKESTKFQDLPSVISSSTLQNILTVLLEYFSTQLPLSCLRYVQNSTCFFFFKVWFSIFKTIRFQLCLLFLEVSVSACCMLSERKYAFLIQIKSFSGIPWSLTMFACAKRQNALQKCK